MLLHDISKKGGFIYPDNSGQTIKEYPWEKEGECIFTIPFNIPKEVDGLTLSVVEHCKAPIKFTPLMFIALKPYPKFKACYVVVIIIECRQYPKMPYDSHKPSYT